MTDKITDIRPQVQAEMAGQGRINIPENGDPRDFTVPQLQQIIADGQHAVQQHLTTIPQMVLGLTNAAQQLGRMQMLLAIKLDEETPDESA